VLDELEIIFVTEMAEAVDAALDHGLDPAAEGPDSLGTDPVRSVA
jgi:hypothetical protein